MYCHQCGALNNDNAVQCTQCSTPLPLQENFSAAHGGNSRYIPYIPSYLAESLVITLCCCLPLGAFAVFNAARVHDCIIRGDYDLADSYSRTAKSMCILSVFCGIGMYIFILISYLL